MACAGETVEILLAVCQTRQYLHCLQLSKIVVPILKLLIFIAAIETIFGRFAFFPSLNLFVALPR